MNREQNVARFEAELGKVQRPGLDKLLEYIRKSDFYTAPASTKYHLACEGGLLQHSLNVLDALRGILTLAMDCAETTAPCHYEFRAAGKTVASIPQDSVIITALLHDICKTYFYTTSWRNAKNEVTGRWEKVPYYTIDDKMPLGHGPKSAMIIKQYMDLTTEEMYAIWHHMGFNGDFENNTAVGAAYEKYPLALALHTADMMASRLMEAEKGNKPAFVPTDAPASESAGEYADNMTNEEPTFEEAPPLAEPGA